MGAQNYLIQVGAAAHDLIAVSMFSWYLKRLTPNCDEEQAAARAAAAANMLLMNDHPLTSRDPDLVETVAFPKGIDLPSELSGGMYCVCYARYLQAGGPRGFFNQPFFEFAKAQAFMCQNSRDPRQADAKLMLKWVAACEAIQKLGNPRFAIAPMMRLAEKGQFFPARLIDSSFDERKMLDELRRFHSNTVPNHAGCA